jgi:hypothetical protein
LLPKVKKEEQMKVVKFLAYPVLVMLVWIAFAAGTLSALATVDASLHSIAAGAQPAASQPPAATTPAPPPRVAHVGQIRQGATHSG